MSHRCPNCGYGCRNFSEQHMHKCVPPGETDAHEARFNELCAYLIKECVKDRPLTDAEIVSAWVQTKLFTLEELLDQADEARKRAKGE